MRIVFNLSSIQTSCLSAFFQRVLGMFSKFTASTLRLYLQQDNMGLLNEDYNYKNEQKWWS